MTGRSGRLLLMVELCVIVGALYLEKEGKISLCTALLMIKMTT